MATSNPIKEFVYNEAQKIYRTTLMDDSTGPNISLADIMVMKELIAMETEAEELLSTSTNTKNLLNAEIQKLTPVKSDIDTNYTKVKQEIAKLKEKIE